MKRKAQIAALICGATVSAMATAMAPVTHTFEETLMPGDTFAEVLTYAAGTYVENTWNFELLEPMGVAGVLSDLQVTNLLGISGFTVNVYGTNFTEANDLLEVSSSLPSGVYAFTVKGTALRSWGGSYALSVGTAPNSEPHNWAIVLVGLGLLGLRIREHLSQAKPHLG